MKSYKFDDLRQVISLRAYRFTVVLVLLFAVVATAVILLNQSSRPSGTGAAKMRAVADQERADADQGRAEESVASRGQSRAAAAAVLPEKTPSGSAVAAAQPMSDPSTSPAQPKEPPAPAAKELDYQYQAQINYYYCGPAATRIALTALGQTPSQDTVAGRLGTTTSGTNSAADTTRVLNSLGGTDQYRTTMISGSGATPAEMDRLQADVVRAISNGYPVVTNIVGSATDTDGGWHGYDGGHYVTVVGYRDDGRTVEIADPANVNGQSYWMTTIALAHWIAQRGYSA